MTLTEQQLAWYEKHRPVMKAFVEGKEVQFKLFDGSWSTVRSPSWLHSYEYRIKPEAPREFYMHREDVRVGGYAHLYPISDSRHVSPAFIKFREVMDE